ncbi:hypothetical protein BDZ97DRAFT_25191 [Flammula alnicola]|nr:hypothetical protein BDZ97DRAFT_25191 [Flammula alnicola]
MPSIRVKGQAYSSLGDVFAESDNAPPDAGPSEQHAPSPFLTPRIPSRLSLPFLRTEPSDTQPSPNANPVTPRRPRSGTTASRIHAHCTSSIRSSQFLPPTQDVIAGGPYRERRTSHSSTGSPENTYPHAGEMMTIEGLQTDLRMSSHGEPGLIENSINLSHTDGEDNEDTEHHHDDVVEHLDVIDPQIGAFASLTNAANSIVIPPSSWYSRKPVVVLPEIPRRAVDDENLDEFEDILDRHVDDVLKRPSKVRRTLMGVWSFLKTPMGIFTGIYGFLVVFWGAAIVIFLVKIINFHNANTQGFWVEVSSQVETGLFTLTSIGLIPSRVLDTYRILKIWMYKRRTMKLRAKAGLPQLFDIDDLPDPIYDPNYVHVLMDEEQKDLHRQQRKFQHSQTWYRAHGTETHRAFPINMALWICFLNDGNSFFQIFLCGTMWGLNRFQRPPWTTGVLIPASFLCGIGAGVMIWKVGEKTKRVEEVRERLRAALTDRPPPRDGQLTQSLSRNPRTQMNSESMVLRDTSEKSRNQTFDSSTMIEEHMTVPPARRFNKELS